METLELEKTKTFLHCLFITDTFYYICIFNIMINYGFKYYALHSLW